MRTKQTRVPEIACDVIASEAKQIPATCDARNSWARVIETKPRPVR
jgi:hypothetical protein